MIFVIGGEHQGKLEYALNLGKFKSEDVIDCNEITISEMDRDQFNKPVIYNFNVLIKKLLKEYEAEEDVKNKIKYVVKNSTKSIIISNEIGYGIVPIDKFERRYRELTGRICCEIAKESESVHRVICGIGTVIKGRKYD